jgi:hypothetical protein
MSPPAGSPDMTLVPVVVPDPKVAASRNRITVRMILKVGGGGGNGHPGSGIPWHMNLANQIEYITTDPQRKVIPWVRLTDAEGRQTVFKTEEFTGAPEDYEIRRMDCIDCHLILAQGSGDELKHLSADGHAFFHVDSEYEDFSCAVCHNGAIMEE